MRAGPALRDYPAALWETASLLQSASYPSINKEHWYGLVWLALVLAWHCVESVFAGREGESRSANPAFLWEYVSQSRRHSRPIILSVVLINLVECALRSTRIEEMSG